MSSFLGRDIRRLWRWWWNWRWIGRRRWEGCRWGEGVA